MYDTQLLHHMRSWYLRLDILFGTELPYTNCFSAWTAHYLPNVVRCAKHLITKFCHTNLHGSHSPIRSVSSCCLGSGSSNSKAALNSGPWLNNTNFTSSHLHRLLPGPQYISSTSVCNIRPFCASFVPPVLSAACLSHRPQFITSIINQVTHLPTYCTSHRCIDQIRWARQ